MNKKESKSRVDDALMTFLIQTKDGKYAKIDTQSIKYSRIKEKTEEYIPECEYFFSIR